MPTDINKSASLQQVSQPQYYWHSKPKNICCRHCPVHCKVISSIFGFYPPDTSNTSARSTWPDRTTKMSPDISKCPPMAGNLVFKLLVMSLCIDMFCYRLGQKNMLCHSSEKGRSTIPLWNVKDIHSQKFCPIGVCHSAYTHRYRLTNTHTHRPGVCWTRPRNFLRENHHPGFILKYNTN